MKISKILECHEYVNNVILWKNTVPFADKELQKTVSFVVLYQIFNYQKNISIWKIYVK